MELKEVISSRRSIRKFKPDPVPEEYVDELLEAARQAPSGTNLQPWRFAVVSGAEKRKKIGECTQLKFVARAPLVIVCCVDTGAIKQTGKRVQELTSAGAFAGTDLENMSADEYKKFRRSMDSEAAVQAYLGLNTALAVEHMVLRAVDLGLGCCWVMMFNRHQLKETLELPGHVEPLALLPVGYPDQHPAPRPRLPVEDIVIKRV